MTPCLQACQALSTQSSLGLDLLSPTEVQFSYSTTQVQYKKLMEPATVDPYDDDEDLLWGETDAEKSCRRKRDLLEAELGQIEELRRTR